jgi:hypothetical protein
MSEYTHPRAYLDPLGLILMPDGSYRQEIELVLTDDPDPDRDPPALADPVLRLDGDRARQLANELLELAEHADHPQLSRSPR